VLRWVRRNLAARLPVLFTTSTRDTSHHHMDAEVCLPKPLSSAAPLACVGMLLRGQNRSEPVAEKLVCGDYEFEAGGERVFVRGNSVTLTRNVFELALLLFKHMSRPLSRTHILDAIWKQGAGIPSRSMDMH